MNLSLYSAASGMEAQQLNLNTIANNLANVNTPGFKRSKIEFQDLLYQKPRSSGTDSGGGNLVPTGIEVGNGSRVAAIQALGGLGVKDAISVLEPFIQHGPQGVRGAADAAVKKLKG